MEVSFAVCEQALSAPIFFPLDTVEIGKMSIISQFNLAAFFQLRSFIYFALLVFVSLSPERCSVAVSRKNKDLSACGVEIEDEQRKNCTIQCIKRLKPDIFQSKISFSIFHKKKSHEMIGTQ